MDENLSKLLSELVCCPIEDQIQKKFEMKRMIDEIDGEGFGSVFKELLSEIHKMIEKKKLSLENAVFMLKHIGYCKTLKNPSLNAHYYLPLINSFIIIISEEEKKKASKNEKLILELCECIFLLQCYDFYNGVPEEWLSLCVPNLLKAALNKDESEEIKKEVEMALLSLCNIEHFSIEQKLYLNEIKEIILYHQKHHNLSFLAYQSAWMFFENRLHYETELVSVFTNELHFTKEAGREIEELTGRVDWMKNEDELERMKEVCIIKRWLDSIRNFLFFDSAEESENMEIKKSTLNLFKVAKDDVKGIRLQCIELLIFFASQESVHADAFLCDAADIAFDEMLRSTLDDMMTENVMQFFFSLLRKLSIEKEEKKKKKKKNVNGSLTFAKSSVDEKCKKEKKETKSETNSDKLILEKLEKEGFEDIMISCSNVLPILNFVSNDNPYDLSDYFFSN